jgi:hypothetical protein
MKTFLVSLADYGKPGNRQVKIRAEDDWEAESKAMKQYPQYNDIRVIREEPILESARRRFK